MDGQLIRADVRLAIWSVVRAFHLIAGHAFGPGSRPGVDLGIVQALMLQCSRPIWAVVERDEHVGFRDQDGDLSSRHSAIREA